MKLSSPEKLILLMLSDIYDKLELENLDTNLIRSAIFSENTWALDWEMPGVVGSDQEPTPPLVIDVVNFLDMWSFLEEAYSTFNPEEKNKIETEAAPFGKTVRFPGFDGNNESELLSITRMLIDDMGRFTRFKGRELNSHFPTHEIYRQMYVTFEPLRKNLLGTRNLSPDQVILILKAQHHI